MTQPFEVHPIDAAVDQLDWAIRLFLDHDAYLAAITLAGAAEGMLEKILRAIDTEVHTAHVSIRGSIAIKRQLDPTQVGKFMRAPRNFLQHANPDYFDFRGDELQTRAINQIVQATINLLRIGRSMSSQGKRFLVWLDTNRSDLRG